VCADVSPGGSLIVGPFSWTPSQVSEHRLVFSVSCAEDPSNIDERVKGPIVNSRLIPHDNNLAQRLVIVA